MSTQTDSECQVEYNYLGRSGVKVSNICLGTLTFGKIEDGTGQGTTSCPTQVYEEGAHKLLDKYVEMGGNFVDTANMYSLGQSEKIVGNWLSKQKRDDIVLATKVRAIMGSGPNDMGLSRRHIVQNCKASLERLQTDYIDLYQTHNWDAATPLEETLRTLDDLVRCGKVRNLGVSNVTGWQMQKFVDKVDALGLNRIISLQQQYNLICRQSELEEFQVCVNEGVAVLPWSPLKGGLLTGKYKKGESIERTKGRIGYIHSDERRAIDSSPAWSKFCDNVFYWNLMDTLSTIAQSHGKSIPQVAIRWLLQKSVVPSVIIGVTKMEQLMDNIGAGKGWSLTLDEMSMLDAASEREMIYPYTQTWRGNRKRLDNPFYPSPFVHNTT